MLNQCTFQGRLTADPELRKAGAANVASFSIAVERDRPDQSGERQTDFIDCLSWNKQAEFVSKYFHKGDAIVVSGRMQVRNWQDKEGRSRRSYEIVTEGVYFGESNAARKARTRSQEPENPDGVDPDEGELPFND